MNIKGTGHDLSAYCELLNRNLLTLQNLVVTIHTTRFNNQEHCILYLWVSAQSVNISLKALSSSFCNEVLCFPWDTDCIHKNHLEELRIQSLYATLSG
jgi:hypothetical protein